MPALPRLAYLTSRYPAVSHTFILREVSALRALGFEVETCSMRQPGPEHLTGPEEREAIATTFFIVENGRKPSVMLAAIGHALRRPRRLAATLSLAWRTAPPGVSGGMKQFAYFAEALVLSRHLAARGVEHLHNHFADPSANVALLTSSLSGIPFSYTLHGPAELYEPEKWALREKTAYSTFVVCISHFARAQAMYYSDPADWEKLKIVHCGVVPERYEAHGNPACEGGVRLVFVGRLTPIKGLRVLLDAFLCARAHRTDLQLTLIGDGDDRPHLEALAAPLGPAVTFAGYRSQGEIASLLGNADIFVLPSFAEGVPVVLMEAMAAGKPVIATAVGGVGELVEEGVSGYIVPPGVVEALARRICDLSDDPDLRARMGRQGRERVRAEFDIRTEAARLGALFAGGARQGVRPEPMQERG